MSKFMIKKDNNYQIKIGLLDRIAKGNIGSDEFHFLIQCIGLRLRLSEILENRISNDSDKIKELRNEIVIWQGECLSDNIQ